MENASLFGLVFCRSLGLISFLPLETLTQGFGLKVILTLFLSISGFTFATARNDPEILDYPIEFMTGFAQALPLLLLLQSIEILGDLIEALRGQTIGSILNPLSQTENAILPILLRNLLWVVILQAGVIDKLYLNFISNINISSSDLNFWRANLSTCIVMLALGFKVSLIFAFLVLCSEVGILMCSKLIPNLQLESLGFLTRSGICIFAVLILIKAEFLSNLIQIYMQIAYG